MSVISDKEKDNLTDLITTAVQVPESKRDFLIGYMQCMVDVYEKEQSRNKCS